MNEELNPKPDQSQIDKIISNALEHAKALNASMTDLVNALETIWLQPQGVLVVNKQDVPLLVNASNCALLSAQTVKFLTHIAPDDEPKETKE